MRCSRNIRFNQGLYISLRQTFYTKYKPITLYVYGCTDHFCLFFCCVSIYHLLESIDSHHHWYAEVLCILYLLLHVAAAILQQHKVLHAGTQMHF